MFTFGTMCESMFRLVSFCGPGGTCGELACERSPLHPPTPPSSDILRSPILFFPFSFLLPLPAIHNNINNSHHLLRICYLFFIDIILKIIFQGRYYYAIIFRIRLFAGSWDIIQTHICLNAKPILPPVSLLVFSPRKDCSFYDSFQEPRILFVEGSGQSCFSSSTNSTEPTMSYWTIMQQWFSTMDNSTPQALTPHSDPRQYIPGWSPPLQRYLGPTLKNTSLIIANLYNMPDCPKQFACILR